MPSTNTHSCRSTETDSDHQIPCFVETHSCSAGSPPAAWRWPADCSPTQRHGQGAAVLEEHDRAISAILEHSFAICLGGAGCSWGRCRTDPRLFAQPAACAFWDVRICRRAWTRASFAHRFRVRPCSSITYECPDYVSSYALALHALCRCLAVRADAAPDLRSHIGSRLAVKSQQAGLRPIGAVAYVEVPTS